VAERCTAIKNGPAALARGTAGQRCGSWPVKGSTVCEKHGGSAPQVRRAAAARLATAKAETAIAREAAKTGRVVLPNQNPLDVLEGAMTDIVRLKDRLGSVVDRLADESLRYPGRAGEQLRGELQAYQSALRDTVKAAETMLKLGIAERRLEIQQAQAVLLSVMLDKVFNDIGLTPDQQAIANTAVPVRLMEISQQVEEAGSESAAVAAYASPRKSPVRR
jgi:hypothetical protein